MNPQRNLMKDFMFFVNKNFPMKIFLRMNKFQFQHNMYTPFFIMFCWYLRFDDHHTWWKFSKLKGNVLHLKYEKIFMEHKKNINVFMSYSKENGSFNCFYCSTYNLDKLPFSIIQIFSSLNNGSLILILIIPPLVIQSH